MSRRFHRGHHPNNNQNYDREQKENEAAYQGEKPAVPRKKRKIFSAETMIENIKLSLKISESISSIFDFGCLKTEIDRVKFDVQPGSETGSGVLSRNQSRNRGFHQRMT